MSRFENPTSTAAEMVRWSAGHWKIAVYGWLAFAAVAFSLDTALGTTILAIPNYRLKATDKTVMTFSERAAGQPIPACTSRPGASPSASATATRPLAWPRR